MMRSLDSSLTCITLQLHVIRVQQPLEPKMFIYLRYKENQYKMECLFERFDQRKDTIFIRTTEFAQQSPRSTFAYVS